MNSTELKKSSVRKVRNDFYLIELKIVGYRNTKLFKFGNKPIIFGV